MAEPLEAGVTHDIVIEIGGAQYGFMLDRRNPYGLQDSNPAIPNVPNTPLSLADYNIWTIDAQDSWLHGFGFGFNRDDMGYDQSSRVETRMSGYLQLLPRIFDWKVWSNAGFTINDIEEWPGGLLGYHLVAFARGNLEGLTYYYENPNPQWMDKPDPDEDATNETVNALLALKDYLLIALNGTNERMVKWNGSTGWTGAGNASNPPKNFGFLERGGGYLWGAEKGTNRLHFAGAEDGSDFEGGETDPNVIKVGVAAPPIIGLCWWRDNLRVAKPDRLYFVDRENLIARTEIPDFAESSTPAMWTGVKSHFESMCPGPGGLWFTIQNRVYRWSGSTLTDVTPPMWGLWPPYVRWHRFHNIQRFNEHMYCIGETEENDEYLLCYANGSWHLLYHLSFGQTNAWQVSKVAISRKYNRFIMGVKDTTAPPWWASAYQRRKKVTVNGSADTLTTVQINLSGADALDIYQDSQADADDVRICFWDGQDWEELNRDVVTFTDSAIDIRFKVKHLIAAASTDDRYYIYYKNSSVTTPPKDLALVYIAGDDFDQEASNVPPSKWQVSQWYSFIRVDPSVYQGASGKSVRFNSYPTYCCRMQQTHGACTTGLIKYTFYVRMETFSGTKILDFRIWDEQGDIGPQVRFWRTGAGVYQILAADKNTWKVILTPISAETWYKVEIIADIDAKNYDVKIDDVLKADNYNFWAGANVDDLRTFWVCMQAGGVYTSTAKAHFDTYKVERPTYASCAVGTEQTVSEEGKIKNFRLRDTTEPYDDYDTGTYRYLYSVRYDFKSQVISKSFWEFIARVNNVNSGGRDIELSYRIDDIGDWINITTLTTEGLHELLFSMPPPKGKWIQFRIGLKTDSAVETPYVDTFGVRAIARPETAWAQRYNILIGDGVRRRDGKFDERSPSDSLQVIMGARDSEEPVTIIDFWRGKRYGYVTSVAVGAIRFLDNMQTGPKKGGAVGSAQIVFIPLREG